MNITERAQKVLTEIDAALALAEKTTPGPWQQDLSLVITTYSNPEICDCDGYSIKQDEDNAAFIAASRTGYPMSLRCLKTAIGGLLRYDDCGSETWLWAQQTLTILCDQWENNL